MSESPPRRFRATLAPLLALASLTFDASAQPGPLELPELTDKRSLFPRTSSPALVKAAAELLPASAAEWNRLRPSDAPVDATAVLARVRAECAGFSIVSHDDADRIQRGVFDDAANRKRADALVRTCADFAIKLTPVESLLMKTDRAEPLRGIKLELFVRLLDAHLSLVSETATLDEAARAAAAPAAGKTKK